MAKETVLLLKAEVTESPRDAPEWKWVRSRGIEIWCTYKLYEGVNQKSYLRKKLMGLNNFLNTV